MNETEYATLWILLQAKELNEFDLTDLKELLSDENFTDWEFTIGWLNSLPNLPAKIRRRMTPDQRNSYG
jgi:hypothetical protein